MSNLSFRITGGTDTGLERSNNEDNFIINSDLSKNDWFIPSDADSAIELNENGCVFVVADGMGGMNAGEVASAIAVDTVKEQFTEEDLSAIVESEGGIEAFLRKVVEIADKKIKSREEEDESTAGMGTTIVIAWVVKDKVHLCWCGDSRAYLFNKKSGLVRLSKDHSYVQQLVDEGKLEPELAFDHPNSNIITRSLGDSRANVDPDYMSRRLVTGDQILLCSDGLCGLCRDEELVEAFDREYSSLVELKSTLMDMALNAGGYDNITIVLFETVSNGNEQDDEIMKTYNDVDGEKKMIENSRSFKNPLVLIAAVLICAVLCIIFFRKIFGDSAANFVQATFADLGTWFRNIIERN